MRVLVPGDGQKNANEHGSARAEKYCFGAAESLASWRSCTISSGIPAQSPMHPEIGVPSARPVIPMSSRLVSLLCILSVLLVITGSLLPASSSVIRAIGRLPVNQKVLHFCGYTWLALLAFLTVKRRSLAVILALSMILLSVALEFGQKLVPGRAFEIRDMFINGFGVLTGIVIGILSRRIVPAVSNN